MKEREIMYKCSKNIDGETIFFIVGLVFYIIAVLFGIFSASLYLSDLLTHFLLKKEGIYFPLFLLTTAFLFLVASRLMIKIAKRK